MTDGASTGFGEDARWFDSFLRVYEQTFQASTSTANAGISRGEQVGPTRMHARSRCIKVNDCGWHCVFVAVIVAGREGHVLAPRLACFSQRNFLHQKLRSSLSFSTQQFHSSIPYSQPHNCKYGFHRSRLRSRPDSPEQLCQDPQLHRWVSSYPASHFVPPCIFPLHRVALPPFHDENNWSVLMRRLKTPLSEYKTTRLSQL